MSRCNGTSVGRGVSKGEEGPEKRNPKKRKKSPKTVEPSHERKKPKKFLCYRTERERKEKIQSRPQKYEVLKVGGNPKGQISGTAAKKQQRRVN